MDRPFGLCNQRAVFGAYPCTPERPPLYTVSASRGLESDHPRSGQTLTTCWDLTGLNRFPESEILNLFPEGHP